MKNEFSTTATSEDEMDSVGDDPAGAAAAEEDETDQEEVSQMSSDDEEEEDEANQSGDEGDWASSSEESEDLEGSEIDCSVGNEEDGSSEEEDTEEEEDESEDTGDGTEEGPSNSQMMEVDSDDSATEYEKCPICLANLKSQDVGSPEACDHSFCLECIVEWAKNVNTCPVDRQVFNIILAKHSIAEDVYKQIPVQNRELELEEQEYDDTTYCEICRLSDHEDRMLLCDGCDLGYHLDCLTPVLARVPRGEWFCPTCAATMPARKDSSDEEEVVPNRHYANPYLESPRRRIGRTLIYERVIARISRLRQHRGRILSTSDSEWDPNGDEDEGAAAAEAGSASMPTGTGCKTVKRKRKVVRRKGTKRRKVTRKRKSPKKRKSKKKASSSTGTKAKTTKRKRKVKRKSKKRKTKSQALKLARTKRFTPTTIKKRIAGHLGLSSPPVGRTIPLIKEKVQKPIDVRRSDIGVTPLSLMGDRNELQHFSDPGEDDPMYGGSPGGSTAVARPVVPRIGPRYAKTPVTTRPHISRSLGSFELSCPPVAESAACDLLGDILKGQSFLALKSNSVKINRDGTLEAKRAEMRKGLPLQRQGTSLLSAEGCHGRGDNLSSCQQQKDGESENGSNDGSPPPSGAGDGNANTGSSSRSPNSDSGDAGCPSNGASGMDPEAGDDCVAMETGSGAANPAPDQSSDESEDESKGKTRQDKDDQSVCKADQTAGQRDIESPIAAADAACAPRSPAQASSASSGCADVMDVSDGDQATNQDTSKPEPPAHAEAPTSNCTSPGSELDGDNLEASEADSPGETGGDNLEASDADSPGETGEDNFEAFEADSPGETGGDNLEASEADSPGETGGDNLEASDADCPGETGGDKLEASDADCSGHADVDDHGEAEEQSPGGVDEDNNKGSEPAPPDHAEEDNLEGSIGSEEECNLDSLNVVPPPVLPPGDLYAGEEATILLDSSILDRAEEAKRARHAEGNKAGDPHVRVGDADEEASLSVVATGDDDVAEEDDEASGSEEVQDPDCIVLPAVEEETQGVLEVDLCDEDEEDEEDLELMPNVMVPFSELPRIPKRKKEEAVPVAEVSLDHPSVLERLHHHHQGAGSYPKWEPGKKPDKTAAGEKDSPPKKAVDKPKDDVASKDYEHDSKSKRSRSGDRHRERDRDRDRDRKEATSSSSYDESSYSSRHKHRRHSRSRSRERSRPHRSRSRDRSRKRSRSRDRRSDGDRSTRRRSRDRSRERKRRSRSRSRSPRRDRRREDSATDFKGSVKMFAQSMKEVTDEERSGNKRFRLKRNFYQQYQEQQAVEATVEEERHGDADDFAQDSSADTRTNSGKENVPHLFPSDRNDRTDGGGKDYFSARDHRNQEGRRGEGEHDSTRRRSGAGEEDSTGRGGGGGGGGKDVFRRDNDGLYEKPSLSHQDKSQKRKIDDVPPPRSSIFGAPPPPPPDTKHTNNMHSPLFKVPGAPAPFRMERDSSYDPCQPTDSSSPPTSHHMPRDPIEFKIRPRPPFQMQGPIGGDLRCPLRPPGMLREHPPREPPPGPAFLTVGDGPIRQVMQHVPSLGMVGQHGMGQRMRPPMLVNRQMVGPPMSRFPRMGPQMGWQQVNPSNLLIHNRMPISVAQNGLPLHRGGPTSDLFLNPPPRLEPPPNVPENLGTPPPPLPPKALEEMQQISQLLNAQAKLAQLAHNQDDELQPPQTNLFKSPMGPPPPFSMRSSEPKSVTFDDTTEVVDMEVASPLSDDEVTLSFSPPPIKDLGKSHDDPRSQLSSAGEELPGSATELEKRQQLMRKMNRQERVVEEVKQAIKPHYSKGKINKDEYKDVMRKAVPKICRSKSGDINPEKIRNYIDAYVEKMRKMRKYVAKKDSNVAPQRPLLGTSQGLARSGSRLK